MITPGDDIEDFLNKQENLDVITYFSRGDSYEKIAKKIKGNSESVTSVIENLEKYELMSQFGRWNVDVNALGMIKTFEFCSYTEDGWNRLFKRNFYLSYFSQVEVGRTKYLAMYTFPEEVKDKIGCEITSWYYTFPHFRVPLFMNGFNKEEFFRSYEESYEEEDNTTPLPPRGERIENPDLIDFYICRYVQFERGAINLKEYTERMKKEIGDIIDVSEDDVKKHFEILWEKHVIYPIVPLLLSKISYVPIYCITSLEVVFRLMKTLNKFNVITAISFIMGNKYKYFLYFQCPHKLRSPIMTIFDQLDKENEIYFFTKTYENRGFPYKYYLEKYRKSQEDKGGW